MQILAVTSTATIACVIMHLSYESQERNMLQEWIYVDSNQSILVMTNK